MNTRHNLIKVRSLTAAGVGMVPEVHRSILRGHPDIAPNATVGNVAWHMIFGP